MQQLLRDFFWGRQVLCGCCGGRSFYDVVEIYSGVIKVVPANIVGVPNLSTLIRRQLNVIQSALISFA